jgi:hypothetical protein
MAKAKIGSITVKLNTTTKKRPGIHAKSSKSRIKTSKNYQKLYRGQGK